MAIFGQPAATPFDEAAQRTADQQQAFANIKDNLPALGLIAGLSMLARNNGTRSVGQLIGQAGGDALNAYGTWQRIEAAKQRQKMLDDIAAEERQYGRSQDAFRNDLALKQFGLQEAKMAQDMAIQRQRLALAQANAAAQRKAAAEAAATGKLVTFNGVPGYIKDGVFNPVKDTEGNPLTAPVTGASSEFVPLDAKGKGELYSIGESDMLIGNLKDKLQESKGRETGGVVGSTGLMIGSLPTTVANRIDPEGVALRSAISNFSSQIMNALSGAAISEHELKRLEGFLPTATDDWETLNRKITEFENTLRLRADNWSSFYGPHARVDKLRVKRRPALDGFDTEK